MYIYIYIPTHTHTHVFSRGGTRENHDCVARCAPRFQFPMSVCQWEIPPTCFHREDDEACAFVVPYGTLWYPMVPYGTLWYPILRQSLTKPFAPPFVCWRAETSRTQKGCVFNDRPHIYSEDRKKLRYKFHVHWLHA